MVTEARANFSSEKERWKKTKTHTHTHTSPFVVTSTTLNGAGLAQLTCPRFAWILRCFAIFPFDTRLT